MSLSRLQLSVIALAAAISAGAVPAKRGLQTVVQPDGTELQIQRVGDEHSHFMLTADRKLLTKDADGVYRYAKLAVDGRLVSTGVKAVNAAVRTAADDAVAVTFDGNISAARREAAAARKLARRAIAQSGMGLFTSNFPCKGAIKGLVILVQYQDVKFKISDPHAYFNAMLNQEGFNQYGGTGSARDFYVQNSNGQFTPQFDVYGPYTLPNNMSYYGGNDMWDEDQAPEDMVVHACQGLDSEINFADYDNDNDGYVDNVYVFYAGQGEASYGSEDTVWPHSWELSSAKPSKVLTLDGKKIDRYACSNEWENTRPDGIGTFVHEFSHVMGLPDLYQTDGGTNCPTPGEWSVMDYGPYNNEGRTPPAYSIYERNALQWMEPTVIAGPMDGSLEHIIASNKGYIIPTEKTTEFFLVENRQQSGWDTYLPGHGMLIWHVDFNQAVWDENSVNNTKTHQYVQIEPANNNTSTVSGWAFPASATRNAFTPTTSPAMKSWGGKAVNYPITDIAEASGIVTFKVLGGKPAIEAPTGVEIISNSASGFKLGWAPVEGATDYLVSLTASVGAQGEIVSENCDGKNLPAGWSKSSGVDKYTSAGNFVTGTQSLKLSATGHAVTTGQYANDVNSISFWFKSQQASDGSKLEVEGMINGEWVNIHTINLTTANKGEYCNLDNLASTQPGIRQVRFIYTKVKGNLSLDDITVATGGAVIVAVPGYTDRSTAGQPEITVDLNGILGVGEIPAGQQTFKVTVKATNGTDISLPATVEVDLSAETSLGTIETLAAPTEYYNLQGVRVMNPTKGLYIVKRGNEVRKVVIR